MLGRGKAEALRWECAEPQGSGAPFDGSLVSALQGQEFCSSALSISPQGSQYVTLISQGTGSPAAAGVGGDKPERPGRPTVLLPTLLLLWARPGLPPTAALGRVSGSSGSLIERLISPLEGICQHELGLSGLSHGSEGSDRFRA